MSVGPPAQQPPNSQFVERERVRVARLHEEVARLCEADVPEPTFFAEALNRLLEALTAPAGVIFMITPEGQPAIKHQVNLNDVGINQSEQALGAQNALLNFVVRQPQPLHLWPQTSMGSAGADVVAPGNPTNYLTIVVPITANGQVIGLIQTWLQPNRSRDAVPGFIQYVQRIADLITRYQRSQRLGQLVHQQSLWSDLEAFSRQIHSSLHPVEVAYAIANEGRRIIDCDRLCVGVRTGWKVRIEAVSGADVVETRSNLINLLRILCDRVIEWGEQLIFRGEPDEGLPPKVHAALDAYLAESNSKLLVISPLKDKRQEKTTQLARSVLIMECFEPPEEPEQLISRLEVVENHATTALFNAAEYRRIPMRFLWLPLAKLQDGVGGKAKAIMLLVCLALTLIGGAFYLIPLDLKMDASGQLLPTTRRVVYPQAQGTIGRFHVNPGDVVREDDVLAVLFDQQFKEKIDELNREIAHAQHLANSYESQAKQAMTESDRIRYDLDAVTQMQIVKSKSDERDDLVRRMHADRRKPGKFSLVAPKFSHEELAMFSPEARARGDYRTWTVLNGAFREEFTNKGVSPADPILRLGAKDGPWEIELKIPQKNIGQVLEAFERMDTNSLDVDFLLRTHSTQVFKGKLYRDRISGQAASNREDAAETEPYVLAYVRIDDPSIPAEERLPTAMLKNGTVSGAEVHAKIRCGSHRMGYSLFYGVWEFFYEKVVFFF